MKKFRFLLLAAFVFINFTNCEDDYIEPVSEPEPEVVEEGSDVAPMTPPEEPNEPTNPTTFNYDFGNDVMRDFIGIVVNENNLPINAATITIGDASTTTDANGMFILKNAIVKENLAYIQAAAAGYFNGFKSILPLEGENSVKIMLKEQFSVVRNSGTAFSLEYDEYAIGFSGDFVKEDGSPYNGPVTIAFNYLSPTDENLNDLMLGMLLGQAVDGEPNLLETFGMLTVELTGSANETLQIASDSELKFPIATSQLATAPSTIPLWYFNEEAGYWVEDGVATKVGDNYIGNVTHFSTWNVDAPIPIAKIDLTVLNQNNAALLGVHIFAYADGEVVPRIFTTNKDGKACGFVPANEIIALEVRGQCNEVVATLDVGPFANGSTNVIPPIIINQVSVPQVEVRGTLKKCDNTNVTNGYIVLRSGANQLLFTSVSDGDFELNAFICDNASSFTLQGYDEDNAQSSGEINYSFISPITDVGDILTCNDVDEYIIYRVRAGSNGSGVNTIVTKTAFGPFDVSLDANGLLIQATAPTFTMDFPTSSGVPFTAGTYELDSSFKLFHGGSSPTIDWRSSYPGGADVLEHQMTVNFIQIGQVGEYIHFTFEGTNARDLNGGNVDFEIIDMSIARVRRDQ
jgi:hypothetical protein